MTHGSVGTGSFYHLLGEQMSKTLNVPMTHVPYKGGADVIKDLLGSQIDIFISPYGAPQVELAKQNKIKFVAALTPQRQALVPQMPSVDESKALKGFLYTIGTGYFVKKDTPEPVVQALYKALNQVLTDPEVRSGLIALGSEMAAPQTLDGADKAFAAEAAQFRAIAKSINLQLVRLYVVYPSDQRYTLGEGIEAVRFQQPCKIASVYLLRCYKKMPSTPAWMRRIWLKDTIDCGLLGFVLSAAFLNTLLFQRPLYALALSTLSALDLSGSLALASLFVLQFAATITIFALVALVSTRLLKLMVITLTLLNSVALYFIDSFGVVLDRSMMGNIFNTNVAEASDLFHPKLLLYVALLGIAPALLVFRLKIIKPSWYKQGLSMVAIVVLAVVWLYANASSWLWLDKNMRQFGGLVLPWSYVVNSARHYSNVAEASATQELLPPASFVDNQRVVVVLVIGESARAKNFSVYGYPRPTNPRLSTLPVMVMPHARSCASYTTESIRCMLSHQGAQADFATHYEPLPSYLQRHGVNVGWRSNNWGQPRLQVGSFLTAAKIREDCKDADCERLNYDEVLLHKLDQQIANSTSTKTFIVLHQTGSHGPQYHTKYPPEFEIFKPACKSVELSSCSTQELVNAYDNTIAYTDHVLASLIQQLSTLKNTAAVMIYASDHGESLGENGLYLHGTPAAVAPDVQMDIPFIAWTSDEFKRQRGLATGAVVPAGQYSHDNVFHSVMGALGMHSSIYKKELDIFQALPKQ